MYRHFVQTEAHPTFGFIKRHACVCGWRSTWLLMAGKPRHPHQQNTISRIDLRDVRTRVGVQSVATLADGTWLIHYQCGHMVHGVDRRDRARSLTNHTVVECQEQPPSVPGAGFPCEENPATGRPMAHEEKSR